MALKEYEGYFSLQNPAVGRVTGRGPLGTRPYDSIQNTSTPPLGQVQVPCMAGVQIPVPLSNPMMP